MPKTNTDFWARKFSDNIERDRRVVQLLSKQGWRVLVVWECELLNYTDKTIEKVSSALREQPGTANQVKYREGVTDWKILLAVAEKKLRYRMRAYDENNG